VAEFEKLFQANPSAAQKVKNGLKRNPAGNGFNADYWRTRSEAFVAETNQSDRMWKDYAQEHRGAAFRIEPNVAKDSKFQKFAPVTYQEKRPSTMLD
jgi:hypothetical protein